MSKTLVIGTVIVVTLLALGSGVLWWQVFQGASVNEFPEEKMVEEAVVDYTATRWVGLIGTPEGLLAINAEGSEESQRAHFLPPGVPLDFFQSLTDYDDRSRENFVQLLEDGRLVFKGDPSITSAPKPNTLYIWPLKSSEAPKKFFEVQENLKIYLFVPSKDLSKVAVISSRLTDEEIRSGDIPGVTSYEDFVRLIEQSEEDLRTISIYDINSKELVSTMQLDEQNQIGLTRLIWGTNTLLVASNQLSVYDPDTGEKILSLDPPSNSIPVSPDGLKYYDGQTGVRYIRSNQLFGQISAPELTPAESVNPNGNLDQQIVFLGPAAFSPDSKKLLLQGGSVSVKSFMVWELDIEKDSTRKIGELSTLIPIQNQPSVGEEVNTFNFLVYHPSRDKALFALEKALPNRVGSADIFVLDLNSQKAQHIAGPFSASNLREVSFIGWYREKIE